MGNNAAYDNTYVREIPAGATRSISEGWLSLSIPVPLTGSVIIDFNYSGPNGQSTATYLGSDFASITLPSQKGGNEIDITSIGGTIQVLVTV